LGIISVVNRPELSASNAKLRRAQALVLLTFTNGGLNGHGKTFQERIIHNETSR